MKQFLKDMFLKKWQYKLFAFFIAIALWFYVVKDQNLSVVLNVPVELSNFPVKMKLMNNIKPFVEVSLEGRRGIINDMDKKEIKVIIDLVNAEDGKNVYVISSNRMEGLPRGLYIKDVSPARLSFEFEDKEKKAEDKKIENKKTPEKK